MASNSSSPSESSLLPSTSSSTRYFDSLPPELLYDIIEKSSWGKLGSWIEEDKKTLLSLCLTSKRLRSIAHPFLLRTIRLEFEDETKVLGLLVENNHVESFSMIRKLHLRRGPSVPDPDLERLSELAKGTFEIQELSWTRQYAGVKLFFGMSEFAKVPFTLSSLF